MRFNIRRSGRYVSVSVEIDSATLDIGNLNLGDAMELASELSRALVDLTDAGEAIAKEIAR